MKVLFFKEDLDINPKYGPGRKIKGIFIEGTEDVFCYDIRSPIGVYINKQGTEYVEKVNKLFTQRVFEEDGDEFLGGPSRFEVLEIKEISEDDPLIELLERVRRYLEERKKIRGKFLSFFPENEKG